MRYLSITALAVTLYFLFPIQLFSQGVSMSPSRLFFSGKPGETLVEKVLLHNNSANDYVLNVNKKDWKRMENGEKVYFTAGELAGSNAAWISTEETNLQVPAGATREILVTMKVPENASQEDVTNSMLFFTQIGKQKDEQEQVKSIGVITLFEFGLHIYFTPQSNANKSIEIISMATARKDSATTALVRLKNDGNVVCDGKLEFELTHKESGNDIKLPPVNFSMMPGAEQVIPVSFPGGLKGNYLGVAIVKMSGTNDLRVGEKDLSF